MIENRTQRSKIEVNVRKQQSKVQALNKLSLKKHSQ